MTAGIMPCNGIVEERRRYNGSIPCRENKGLLFKTPVYFFATLINFFGNLAIFVPIGFFPALLFRDANWKRSAIIGFGMSALIELAQYFIMRNVAVDDIILNTAGAICGYLLYLFIRKHWTNFTDGFLCREVSKG